MPGGGGNTGIADRLGRPPAMLPSGCSRTGSPVAGDGSGGSSSVTLAGAPGGPMAAPRRLTDCSTRPPSIDAPTRRARGGLPSMASRATPAARERVAPAAGRRPSAMTPSSRKRALSAAGTGAASATAAAAARRAAATGRRAAMPPALASVVPGGTAIGTTASRNAQKTAPAAAAAQITKADSRAGMRRLSSSASPAVAELACS